MTAQGHLLVVRNLGVCDYARTYSAMQAFTAGRDEYTPDEIWNLQHPPVYTLGRAGKDSHLRDTSKIPVLRVDRGGQVTYHGPGQLTQYLLLNISNLGLGVRQFVSLIEEAIIALLSQWDIQAQSRPDAPGVYVEGRKIGSLGLRISRGYSYHGLSLNVDMDMQPWAGIDPCGLGVPVTRISDWVTNCPSVEEVGLQLTGELQRRLGYNEPSMQNVLPDHLVETP